MRGSGPVALRARFTIFYKMDTCQKNRRRAARLVWCELDSQLSTDCSYERGRCFVTEREMRVSQWNTWCLAGWIHRNRQDRSPLHTRHALRFEPCISPLHLRHPAHHASVSAYHSFASFKGSMSRASSHSGKLTYSKIMKVLGFLGMPIKKL